MAYNQYEMKLEERYKSINPIINKIHKKQDLKFKILRVEEAILKLMQIRKNIKAQRDRLEDDIDQHVLKYGSDFTKYVQLEQRPEEEDKPRQK